MDKEKRSTVKFELPYVGTLKSQLIQSDVYVGINDEYAGFYILPIKQDYSNETLADVKHITWNYYNINRHLFSYEGNINKQIVIVRCMEMFFHVDKEDLISMLLNIKQSIDSASCKLYTKDRFCSCEKCYYTLSDKNIVVIDFVAMPEKGLTELFDKFMGTLA